MAEENNIYKNEVLSATLQNVYIGLSGLYDSAKTQKANLEALTSARTQSDDNIITRVATLLTAITSTGSVGSTLEQLGGDIAQAQSDITYMSGVVSGEIADRVSGDLNAITSAKQYVDTTLASYYTTTQIDVISGILDQKIDNKDLETLNSAKEYADTAATSALTNAKEYADTVATSALTNANDYTDIASAALKAKDDEILSALNLIDSKSISGTNAIVANTVEGVTTVSLALSDASVSAILTQDSTGLKANVAIVKCTTLNDATNNAAEYALVTNNGTELGERIAVTKDKFLSGVTYDSSLKTLTFNFILADGSSSPVDVAIGDLVDTYTGGNGIDVTNNVITAVKAADSEDYLEITSAGIKVTGVEEAILSAVAIETAARLSAISGVQDDITEINTNIATILLQLGLGDNTPENSITERIATLETVLPVSAITSGNLLVEMNASGQIEEGTGNWKLNPNYNPGINLAFNNKVIEYGATKITFAGTVTTTKTADGEVKVQIGENMNSSSWNVANDGKTNGTVNNITTSTGLLNGATVNATKTAINSFTSNGNIHFDEGDNLWTIKVTADNEEIVNVTLTDTLTCDLTGTPTWTASEITGIGSTAITASITNKAREDNYPSAVGGRAKRTFTVDLSKLGNVTNKKLKIQIAGCGGSFTSTEFYYVTGVTPSVADTPTLVVNNGVPAYYSGVEYYGQGTTFTFTTGKISNLNNQLEVNTSTNKLTFSGTNCSTPTAIKGGNYTATGLTGAGSAQDNEITSYETTVTANNNVNTSTVSVAITPTNYFGAGTAKTAILNTDKPVNTYYTASTDTELKCKAENYRVINSSVTGNDIAWTNIKFNSQSSLGSDELQLIPGVGIKYPANNEDAANHVRYFTRKFIKSGSLTGSTITFTFGSGNLSNIIVLIMKSEGVWTPVNRSNGTYSYATADSTSSKLVLSFSDTNANGGYWFRVGMVKGSSAVITNITMA